MPALAPRTGTAAVDLYAQAFHLWRGRRRPPASISQVRSHDPGRAGGPPPRYGGPGDLPTGHPAPLDRHASHSLADLPRRHLYTFGTSDIAWWQLHWAMSCAVRIVAGDLVGGLTAGLTDGLVLGVG